MLRVREGGRELGWEERRGRCMVGRGIDGVIQLKIYETTFDLNITLDLFNCYHRG